MLRYIVRRLLQLVLVLFVLSLLLFIWLRSLPGGPCRAARRAGHAGEGAPSCARPSAWTSRSIVQYFKFLGRVLQRQLRQSTGVSPGTPALDVFVARGSRATIELSHRRDDLRASCSASRSATWPPGDAAAWFDNVGIVVLADRHRGPGVLPGLPAQVRLRGQAGLAARRPGRQTAGHRRHPGHRALHPRRPDHPGVGRRLGRGQAPDPAVDRAGHHPVRGDLPDHPGLGARGAGRGLRPHRRGQGPDHTDHPEPARAAQRACCRWSR